MQPTTQKEMITNALAMGALFAVIMFFWTRDIVQAAVMALIMMPTLYVGYWASNRVANQIAKRIRPEAEPPPPPESTTERPEHVQRRRYRRRSRARRSAGSPRR